jgi:hypothetical protein
VTIPFDEFLRCAAPNLQRRCYCEISALLYRADPNSAWRGVSVRLTFGPRGAFGTAGEEVFDSGQFRVRKGVVDRDKVQSLIDAVRTGDMAESVLPDGWGAGFRFGDDSPGFYGPDFFTPGDAIVSNYPRPYSGYRLQSQAQQRTPPEAFRLLERTLPASDPPFGGVSGLADEMGLPTVPAFGTSDVLELVSPYWVTIHDARVDRARQIVSVTVKSLWRDLSSDLSVSLIPIIPSPSAKQRIGIDERHWGVSQSAEGGRLFKRDFPIGEGPVEVHLNFRNESIQSTIVGAGSNRLVAHEALDFDCSLLRAFLSGRDSRQGDNFEIAAAWLLHLAGFSACRYGYKRVQRSVDIHAFIGDARALFVECTIEPADADKMNDVISRAKALENLCDERRGGGVRVIPVLFVGAPRAGIDTRESPPGLIVFALEDLESLLDRVLRGASATEIFDGFASSIEQQELLARFTS